MEYVDHLFVEYEGCSQNQIFFEDAFKTFNGGTFESKYYVDSSPYKLITIKNIGDSGFDASTTSYLTKEKALKKFELFIGDILLTMTGNIGRTGIVDENNCYLNQRVLKLECSSKLYLLCYLRKYKDVIIQLGRGTAQKNLSLEDLNKLKVFNSLREISAFSRYDLIFNLLTQYKLEAKKLNNIKASLLSKYF